MMTFIIKIISKNFFIKYNHMLILKPTIDFRQDQSRELIEEVANEFFNKVVHNQ